MKEFYTRRDVLKRAGAAIVGGGGAMVLGQTIVDRSPEQSGDTERSDQYVQVGRDIAGIALTLVGLGTLGAGVLAGLMAAVNNLPTDDQGNKREIIGYTSSDHMFSVQMPIYGDRVTESDEIQ